jgi:hypothetical protein
MRKRWMAALAGLVIMAALGIQGDLRAAPTGLTANINIAVGGSYSSTVDLMTAQATLAFGSHPVSLSFGTGLNQADRVFTDTRSVAAAEDLDVSGGALTDAFGNVFTIAELKVLIVCAATANTGNVVLGGDAASVLFLDTAATTTTIKPGGCRVFTDPSAAGITVTNSTADIIQVAPSAGTQAYDILIIGSSA